MNRDYLLACLAFLIMAGIVAFAYVERSSLAILNPQGPVALGERSVILLTVGLCAIVVIPLFVLLFAFAWKYRATNPRTHVEHTPNWDHDSFAAEFFWWLVPSVIIAVLAIVAWQSSHALDPYKPLDSAAPPMTIQVVALDWKWLFIYPAQGIASVNVVEFPENVPVHFELTADAPMNSFWIPSLGGQIMVMPGMTTQLNLMASDEGAFNGFSGNISGDGFAGMAFTAKSVSPSDFASWVQSVQESSSTELSAPAYQSLAAPSEYNPVSYYSSVDPSLYTSVTMKYMMPENEMPMTMPMNMPMTSMP